MLQTTSGETHSKNQLFQIKDRSEVESSLRNFSEILENILSQNCANNLTNSATSDSLQNLIYSRRTTRGCLRLIFDTVIHAGITSEKRSPGSSQIFLASILYFIKHITESNNRRVSISNIRKEIVDFSRELSEKCESVSRVDMENLVSSIFKRISLPDIEQIISEIIEEVSPNTEIIVEKGLHEKTSGFRSDGHFLKIEIPQIYSRSNRYWIRENVDIILVDGFIESVSQVHHILSKYSENARPLLIVCRKSSDEVRETIFHNFKRNTLDLIIIEVDFDPMYVNIFEDFKAIYGCNVAEIKMGDTLSSRLEKKIFTVDRIKASSSGISFSKNNNLDHSLKKHILNLQELRDSSQNILEGSEIVSEIISERIRFLSSSTYEIKVGKLDINKDPSIVEKIDKFFRSISEMSNFGIVNSENLKSSGALGQYICNKFDTPVFLQKSVALGLVSAFQTLKLFTNAEKMLILDR